MITEWQDLVSRLTPDNFAVNNGVLQVAHSIFKRWRPLFKSDDLYTEINHVLGKFDNPFLVLVQVRALGFDGCGEGDVGLTRYRTRTG